MLGTRRVMPTSNTSPDGDDHCIVIVREGGVCHLANHGQGKDVVCRGYCCGLVCFALPPTRRRTYYSHTHCGTFGCVGLCSCARTRWGGADTNHRSIHYGGEKKKCIAPLGFPPTQMDKGGGQRQISIHGSTQTNQN
jgi:hypothetical protein